MKLANVGKTGRMIIFAIVVLIIVSFALTGIDGGGGSADSVASVDGNPIKYGDYQRELQTQMDRYSQAFGGKPLTAQQMKLFRVKDQVLDRLIEKAVWENITESMSIKVGKDEIKSIIKELPYFQRDKEFDVNLYRNLLRANKLTAQMFEDQIYKDTSVQKTFEIVRSIGVSKNFTKDMLKFKNMGAQATGIRIEKNDVASHLKVTKAQISKMLADKTQEPILKSFFGTLMAEYNTPGKVKARHILIKDLKYGLKKAKKIRAKVTTANFAKIAGKETEDTSGKGKKGGDLGWFGKGKMVPEFEKTAFAMKPGTISNPVKTQFGYHIIYVEKKKKGITKTYEQVKKDVAKRHIQKISIKEKADLFNSVVNQLGIALKANKMSKVKSLVKKYDLELFEKTKLSLFDQRVGSINLDSEDMEKLFNNERTVNFLLKSQGAAKSLIYITKRTTSKDFADIVKKKLAEEVKKESDAFRNKLSTDVTNKIKEQSTIVKRSQFL